MLVGEMVFKLWQLLRDSTKTIEFHFTILISENLQLIVSSSVQRKVFCTKRQALSTVDSDFGAPYTAQVTKQSSRLIFVLPTSPRLPDCSFQLLKDTAKQVRIQSRKAMRLAPMER
jgi:hypothetical protein